MKRKPEQGMPVLRGHLDRTGKQIIVYCPYCNRNHTHGWPEGSKGISHRQAHCDGEANPLTKTGYYIGLWRKKDLED